MLANSKMQVANTFAGYFYIVSVQFPPVPQAIHLPSPQAEQLSKIPKT